MPINPDAVGDESEPHVVSWTSKDALLYAVGVGCGYPDPLQELQFTTENSHEVNQQVVPTFPVVLGGDSGALRNIGTFNPMFLVHGEQGVQVHGSLPVEGSASVVSRVTGIYDKGSGAVIATASEGVDLDSGRPMFTKTSSLFIRGEGGWGGERGPAGGANTAPDRAPDHEITYQTKPDQALVYRLSGDRNPLHVDPWFAQMGGFDRPILHGLCTYGFTGRALLHALCRSDPARFRSMEGRFSKPVFPGDPLTISMWVDGDGTAIFRTSVNGTTVLDNGRCTFTA